MSVLARPTTCGHWSAATGSYCGATETRRFLLGYRCAEHGPGGHPTLTVVRDEPAPSDDPFLVAALDLAANGWEPFPLKGKAPAIRRPHPSDVKCAGKIECGKDGHGVLDASNDPHQIRAWWTAYPGSNIAVRVPAGLVVVDTDPRKPKIGEWDALVAEKGLPDTLTVASGRGDGGLHRYFAHPGGKVSTAALKKAMGWTPGECPVDLKTSSGYVVVPPSIHPASGEPYRWVSTARPAELPPWLLALLKVQEPPRQARKRSVTTFTPGTSIADQFSASTTWAQILEPHGWRCRSHDGDADGAVWLHPDATSNCSATVRHGCLFVYSTSTALPVTETGDPHGLTRFRAWAILDHGGDMGKAWEALGGVRGVRAEDLMAK